MLDLSDPIGLVIPIDALDGVAAVELRARLGLPDVRLFASVGSTLDVAHRLAGAGAPAGTLIIADRQSQGRGRAGKSWQSAAGRGLWLTLIERPTRAASLGVLTLRLGVALAGRLDPFAGGPVGLKWPNDLYIGSRKLGGILVEARWRGQTPEWLAIGVGINVLSVPGVSEAVGLADGVTRLDVLSATVPAIHTAAAEPSATLDDAMLADFVRRDIARGRRCLEPAYGTVRGITPRGELLIATAEGECAFTSGSLTLAEDS
jgi:BirA family biotin operon repressor/biotin-[acetyl-CoA-carboxylase] ligase